jgi:hypothetical protein
MFTEDICRILITIDVGKGKETSSNRFSHSMVGCRFFRGELGEAQRTVTDLLSPNM